MTTSIKFRALTIEDQRLFFEALGEYGKDFQSIQQYMTQKGSQKGSNSNNAGASSGSNNNYNNASSATSNGNIGTNAKSSEQIKPVDPQEKRELDKKDDDRKREQIRNFYNKLYAKLSDLIGKIDDRVEKVNQELYLLINYGEIWKKYDKPDKPFYFSKIKKPLEELVYQGKTTFRLKRLKTPACKALKKINKIGVDEESKVVTTRDLPKDVIVEFHPASNRDWLRVQSMSQNPRVRARLSIQKRLSSILDFLEHKWNLSEDKLNRTVDVWMKTSTGNHSSLADGGLTSTNPAAHNINTISYNSNNDNNSADIQEAKSDNVNVSQERLRIKPSNHHELKEVNVTRVVPDNHLDLSLSAYIKRLEAAQPRSEPNSKEQSKRDSGCSDQQPQQYLNQQQPQDEPMALENFDSFGANKSRLPVSLTTPDCSILLERSCTSDQPSIARTRKHLNILQSLAGTLEGCENSRTAYEDTQERSLTSILMNQNSRSITFAPSFTDHEPTPTMQSNIANKDIAALYDEDAALPVSSSATHELRADSLSFGNNNNNNNNNNTYHVSANSLNSDSKSVDLHIPKNVTLGEFFKMSEPAACDDAVVAGDVGDEAANDAFPVRLDDECDPKDVDRESEEPFGGLQARDNNGSINGQVKLQNHVIEIKKFAEGWTRQDEPTITLGELYLAFKCSEEIILEYEFEQSDSDNLVGDMISCKSRTQNTLPSGSLISKLLTAASLSLAQIQRKRQEQHRLHETQQACSKVKRRKGPGQGQTMTLHDIEATNQRVEEALKQLQPIRLSSFKRAR